MFILLSLDELIRQVTVDCAERGLLLLRVRDEIRMTTAAYRTLYETSVDFGKKKAVEAERGKQEMLDKVHMCCWHDFNGYNSRFNDAEQYRQ